MPMHFFTFLAAPTPEAKEFHTAGGAYVKCWIQNGDRQSAEERARELIVEYGWTVDALEGEAVVTGADYLLDDEEDREFYEQALMEREVLVFHTWPPGDGDDDEDDEEGDEDGEDEEDEDEEPR